MAKKRTGAKTAKIKPMTPHAKAHHWDALNEKLTKRAAAKKSVRDSAKSNYKGRNRNSQLGGV